MTRRDVALDMHFDRCKPRFKQHIPQFRNRPQPPAIHKLTRIFRRRIIALNYAKRPLEELYDVRADPDQVNNLAANPAVAATKEKLWLRLRSYLQQTGDPRISGRDPWQGYAYRQTVGYGATFNRTLSAAERDAAAGRGAHKPQ